MNDAIRAPSHEHHPLSPHLRRRGRTRLVCRPPLAWSRVPRPPSVCRCARWSRSCGASCSDRGGRVAVLDADGARAALPRRAALLAQYDEMRLPLALVGGDGGRRGGRRRGIRDGRAVARGGPHEARLSGARCAAGRCPVDRTGDPGRAGELDAAFLVEGPHRPRRRAALDAALPGTSRGDRRRADAGRDARQALAANPFLRFDRGQRTGVLVERALRRAHLRVNEFLELNSIEALVELVRQEVGRDRGAAVAAARAGATTRRCALCRCRLAVSPWCARSACWSGATTAATR